MQAIEMPEKKLCHDNTTEQHLSLILPPPHPAAPLRKKRIPNIMIPSHNVDNLQLATQLLYNPSFHFMLHVACHLILHYCGIGAVHSIKEQFPCSFPFSLISSVTPFGSM